MKDNKLLTIDDALCLSVKEVLDLNSTYLNAGLIQLMSLAGFTKHMTKASNTKIYDVT